MKLTDVVDRYYLARGYKQPSATESLIWLISELGELAEAHISYAVRTPPPFWERVILSLMILVGRWADRVVSKKGGWVRNNGRVLDKPLPFLVKLDGEVGDVLMMLTVYSNNHMCDPVDAMLGKMSRKGFKLDGNDQEPIRYHPGDLRA